ncbi:hypothetical protein [Streptomyces sp. NPDC001833]|uniref:hypothetical protein n=1 Tax=Streptomyces sp. NPDC001833 TaxID=3154658 RepID=UPI003329FEE8
MQAGAPGDVVVRDPTAEGTAALLEAGAPPASAALAEGRAEEADVVAGVGRAVVSYVVCVSGTE